MEARGFECIVVAMQGNQEECPLQEAGCRAIEQLVSACPPKSSETADKLSQLKVPKLVVQAMRQHSDDESLIVAGAGALRALGSLEGSTRVQVVTDGGLDVLISAMKVHDSCEAILQLGVDIVPSLVGSDEMSQGKFRTLGADKVIKDTARTLGRHKKPGLCNLASGLSFRRYLP